MDIIDRGDSFVPFPVPNEIPAIIGVSCALNRLEKSYRIRKNLVFPVAFCAYLACWTKFFLRALFECFVSPSFASFCDLMVVLEKGVVYGISRNI